MRFGEFTSLRGATCTHALAPRHCMYCSTAVQVSYMKRV